MELVRKVDKSGALIKDKDVLINQLKRKAQDLEEEKQRSEADCCKAMQYMESMKVYIKSLDEKVDIKKNHALKENQNLASER